MSPGHCPLPMHHHAPPKGLYILLKIYLTKTNERKCEIAYIIARGAVYLMFFSDHA